FYDQWLQPAVERGQPCDQAAAAAAHDEQVDRAVPLGGHRVFVPTLAVKPRSTIGTSMVVLVFWMAGSSVSEGRPAMKPSTTRSKLEISPSIRLDNRMY